MNTYGYIYKTTNLINNKIYIGQKKGQFNSNYLGSGKIIQRAVKREGFANFTVIPIIYAFNFNELNKLEIYYIDYYRRLLGKSMLYNISNGGVGSIGNSTHKKNCQCYPCRFSRGEISGENHPMFGKFSSKETKEKQRLSKLGKKLTEEHKKKISESNKGKKLGCIVSNETRQKMSLSRRGVSPANKLPREIRFCQCGCGKSFEVRVNSKMRFIHGHNGRNKKQSDEWIKKRRESFKNTMNLR